MGGEQPEESCSQVPAVDIPAPGSSSNQGAGVAAGPPPAKGVPHVAKGGSSKQGAAGAAGPPPAKGVPQVAKGGSSKQGTTGAAGSPPAQGILPPGDSRGGKDSAKPKILYTIPFRSASKKSSGNINTVARHSTSKKPGSGKTTSMVRPKKVLKMRPTVSFGTVDSREAPKQALSNTSKNVAMRGLQEAEAKLRGLDVDPEAQPQLNQQLIDQRFALARHHLYVMSNNKRNSAPGRESWNAFQAILSTLDLMACHFSVITKNKSPDHPQSQALERLEVDLDELRELKACVFSTVGTTRPTRDMQPSQADLNTFFKNTRRGMTVTYNSPRDLGDSHMVPAGAGAKPPAPKSKVQGGAGVKSPAPKSKVQAVNDGGKTPDAGRPVNPMGGAKPPANGGQDLSRKGGKRDGSAKHTTSIL